MTLALGLFVGELEVNFDSGCRKLGVALVESIDKIGDLEADGGGSMWRRRRGSWYADFQVDWLGGSKVMMDFVAPQWRLRVPPLTKEFLNRL